MTARRILMIAISAATGTCFAVLAGLGISDMVAPFRRFHLASLLIAVVAIALGILAFRAAIGGRTGERGLLSSLVRGIVGAFVGLLAISAFLFMFGAETRELLAHSLGKPATSFTTFRVLLASVLLGFGTGFVVSMPRARARSPKS